MESASHPNNSLPIRLLPLVGRQADLETIFDLLQNPSIRLLTILGPGGVGKTHLAIELARILQDRFEQGAVFIPLAQLNTMDELLPAVAKALEVHLAPGADLQQAVLEYLASQQILLVLDNFEHLLGEAPLIHEILTHGPRLKVLVTSREKLNLEAETLYRLGGLQLPSQDHPKDAQEYGAVHLCLQKAGQVQPGFALNAGNTPAVIQMCQLVDGNPLGILLASAWLEYFSPAEIVEEIRKNLDFLSREARDVEARHFGMRAVFDSSFNRLDEQHQAIFRKLSVFRGGFDLSAAEAVAGADWRTLIALADKSLLAREPNNGRYELHELLRQYAGEKLATAGDQENVLSAYASYYMNFVCQRQRQLISPAQTKALDEIEADFDNIRQAFLYVIEKRDFELARLALPGWYAFCDMRSRFYEGEAMFRRASEAFVPRAGEPPHSAWALALLSWYDMSAYIELLESFEEIANQARTCLEQARSVCDEQTIAASLVLLGAAAKRRGDFKTALQQYEAAMQTYPLLDDVYFITIRIGLCYQTIQDYPNAIESFQVSLERSKITGEHVKMAWSLENIGDTLLMQGKPAEAERQYEQACTLFEEVGTTVGIIWCLYGLSRTALALHRPSRAKELAERANYLAKQIHSASWMGKTDALLHQLDPQSPQILKTSNEQVDEPLSPRELEILQLLKSELSGPDIAQRLVVSLNTIRYHTKNIYRKLGVGTRLEAIQRARELRL